MGEGEREKNFQNLSLSRPFLSLPLPLSSVFLFPPPFFFSSVVFPIKLCVFSRFCFGREVGGHGGRRGRCARLCRERSYHV